MFLSSKSFISPVLYVGRNVLKFYSNWKSLYVVAKSKGTQLASIAIRYYYYLNSQAHQGVAKGVSPYIFILASERSVLPDSEIDPLSLLQRLFYYELENQVVMLVEKSCVQNLA
jgi:hypothetical protein